MPGLATELCVIWRAASQPLSSIQGEADFFPDSAGLFRFRDVEEASQSIERVVMDYEKQCKLARDLAEEYFDARKVVAAVLEQALS